MPKSLQQKREEACERQQMRALFSPSEQLDLLDARLGRGVGAVKERARLSRRSP